MRNSLLLLSSCVEMEYSEKYDLSCSKSLTTSLKVDTNLSRSLEGHKILRVFRVVIEFRHIEYNWGLRTRDF